MTKNSFSSEESSINLIEVIKAVRARIIPIIVILFVVSIASFFYVKQIPNIYQSNVLLSPIADESSSGLGSIAGQFGGLASLAGINLSSSSNSKASLAIEIMQSRDFVSTFILKNNIGPVVVAGESWDFGSQSVRFDTEVYDPESQTWLRKVKVPATKEPSNLELHKEFLERFLRVKNNTETGLVEVSMEHFSPELAQKWLELFVVEINEHMKALDSAEAKASIDFLERKIENTAIANNRNVLYQLIEEQTKTLMFAEARKYYMFNIIDSASKPIYKLKPNRAFIMLGILVTTSFVLFCLVFLEKRIKEA